MNVQKLLWIIPIISQIFFIISLLYHKIKAYLSVSFNSFYLLIINITSLILFHLSFEILFFGSNNLFKKMFSIIFFFSFTIRIKRIKDLLALSDILKSKNIKVKEKSQILYDKAKYSFELSYLVILIVLSTISIYISYIYQITIKIKFIIECIAIIIIIFLMYKILSSEIKKNLKKSYSVEIMIFFILFSNSILSDMNFPHKLLYYQRILFYLTEVLYIIILSINCKFFSLYNIPKRNCLINKKLYSDFGLFLNNKLCFTSFISYANKNDSNFSVLILLTLYLDINTYNLKSSIEEKNDKAKIILNYISKNKLYLNFANLKESIEKIENGNNDENKFAELYKIIYIILNKEYQKYKKGREYKKLSTFLDLLLYLDENVFIKQFYYDYFENDELELI